MPDTNASLRQLRELPVVEIREELETVVVERFKSALLMEADEDLSVDTSFFDLGLTSLRLTSLKQSLEELLGITINANVLFNEPTVEQLVLHLTDLVAGSAAGDRPAQ
ncbi:acyl carrier protein [Streptomyces hypolithicus]